MSQPSLQDLAALIAALSRRMDSSVSWCQDWFWRKPDSTKNRLDKAEAAIRDLQARVVVLETGASARVAKAVQDLKTSEETLVEAEKKAN